MVARAPKLPVFDDSKNDVDAYLQRFERYARSQRWDEENWATNLSALLRGKALEVYSWMALDQGTDYEALKRALLRRFRMAEDGFRVKFRSANPDSGEAASQFAIRIENYFTRWVDLSSAEKTYNGVKDLLLREQFINTIGVPLALYLKERGPSNIDAMTDLAEKYVEAHRGSFSHSSNKRPARPQPTNQRLPASDNNKWFPQKSNRTPPTQRETRSCYKCHRTGHVARDCRSKVPPSNSYKTASMLVPDDKRQSSSLLQR